MNAPAANGCWSVLDETFEKLGGAFRLPCKSTDEMGLWFSRKERELAPDGEADLFNCGA